MIALLLTLAIARADDAPTIAIPGSAWRMSEPQAPWRQRHQLHVFTSADDCRAAGIAAADVDACRPSIDPRRHEVRLAVGVRTLRGEGGAPTLVPVPLPRDRLRAWMLEDLADVEIVAHDPRPYRQLFVLLVDRSASMYAPRPGGVARMREIVGVLQSEGVRRTFFPGTGATGVLLLGFTEAVTGADGGPWQDVPIVTDEEAYAATVDRLLDATTSYTDLYGAIGTAVDDVLRQGSVRDFVAATQGDPAVVVITQGFHDPEPGWTCRRNTAPLVDLLRTLDELQGVSGRPVPMLSVVGLGAPVWPEFGPGRPIPVADVDERVVCGADVDTPVEPTLEARGVDNRSLELIASHGAGHPRYFQDAADVARFLAESAPVPHDWYEVRMRLDPDADRGGAPDDALRHRFRAPMTFRLGVGGSRPLDASVTLFPHPWWDAAPATAAPGATWGTACSAFGSVATWVEVFGLTVGGFGLVAGLRNARRTLRATEADR